MAESEPVQFGRYRLLERLGSGGMASVYRAVVDGRTIVVKRILPQHSREPRFVKMLVSEARVSALLRHPGIVQVYELGQVDGEYFMAMEHVDGWDLGTVLRACARQERRLPSGIACFVVGELAAALGYAHALRDAQGRPLDIVHRDVSPSNVMVARTGAVKLCDFGIAKAAEHFRDERTNTGTLKGKISYMSPEQAEAHSVDARSDIFALGIVLWEALTARRLFKGESDLHTLRLIREHSPHSPSETAPGIDADLDALVMKMLARDPAQRFQRCDEVVRALEPILARHRAGEADLARFAAGLRLDERHPQPPPDPVTGETALPPESPRTVTRSVGELTNTVPSLPPRRSSSRKLAAGIGALAGATLLLALLRPQPAPPAPPPPMVATVSPSPPARPAPAPAMPAPTPTPTPTPQTIHLHIDGPKGARLLLDGLTRGALPFDGEVDRGPSPIRLSVARAGHAPWTKSIIPQHDLTLTVPRPPDRAHPTAAADPEILNPFHRRK